MSHLNNELSLAGLPKINKDNVIDTLDIARDKYPGSGASLDALCKRFRIDNSKREKHNAIIDCELLSKIYVNLLDQKEPSLKFSSAEEIKIELSKKEKIKHSKKVVEISSEEQNFHKSFLKSHLKKNYF